MPILGAGNNRSELLYQKLASLEERLEALAKISSGRPDLDKGDRALKAHRLALADQIKAVEGLIGHPTPEVDGAANQMVTKLWADRLESDDPTLAQYVRKLQQKYHTELDLAAAGGAPTRNLDAVELDAMIGLLGDTMSPAKIHAMEMLLPLMTKAQVEDGYASVMQVSYERSIRATNSGRWEYMGLGAGTMVPLAGAIAFNTAIDAALGPFGILASVGAISLGDQLGQMVKARGDKSEFGINRLEGESVDHDLLRLAERAQSEDLLIGSPKQVQRKVRIESSLIGEVLALRAESGGRPSAAEQKAVASLTTYKAALDKAQTADFRTEVMTARQQLRRTFPFREARNIRTPRGETLDQMPPAEVKKSVDRLIRGANRVVVDITNPPLGQLVDRLEKKYDVEALVGKSSASTAKVSGSEIDALRALVGAVPSVAEFIVVARLVQAKVVGLDDLWPGGTQVALPDGGTIDGATLERALNELGDRSGAKMQESFGKSWLPIIGRLLGAGAATGMAFTGIGLPIAAVVYVLSSIGGSVGGREVQKAGMKRRVLSGVDAAQGQHVDSESSFLMSRYAKPTALPGWSTQPKQTLLRELGITKTLLESLSGQVDHAKEQTAASRAHLASVEQQIAQLPDGERQANEAGLGPLRSLVTQNESRTAQMAATRDRIAQFAGALEALTSSNGSSRTLREGFMKARAELMSPDAARAFARMHTDASVMPEGSGAVARYVGAKGAMLRQLEGLVQSVQDDPSRLVPRYRAFLKPANDANAAWSALSKDRRKKFESDSLDTLIKKVDSAPWDRPSIEELQAILAESSAIRSSLNTSYAATASIAPERAEALVQELLSMWASHIYPLFGADNQGTLNLAEATVKTDKDHEGLPRFTVTGYINGASYDPAAGKISVVVDSEGRPDLDTLSLDVGSRHARRTARVAVEDLVEALGTGDHIAEVVELPGGDGHRFEVTTRDADTWRVSVDAHGFVDHAGIQQRSSNAV